MGRDNGGGEGSGGGVLKQVLLSYSYVSIWIFLSFTVIVPEDVRLALSHLPHHDPHGILLLLVRVLRLVAPPMSRALYLSSVLPTGALYSLSLWFSNSAYIYLSVSFIQMLKALMPVAVYSIGLFQVLLYAQHALHLLRRRHRRLRRGSLRSHRRRPPARRRRLRGNPPCPHPDPPQLQGHLPQPHFLPLLHRPLLLRLPLVPWSVVELPVLRSRFASAPFRPDLVIFGTNSLCAFALNLAVFLLVGKTSALTMNVAGVVKDWLLIAFSWSVIRDTITTINLFGYGIAFLGVAYYNHVKLQALKAKDGQKKTAQESNRKSESESQD